MLETGLLEDPRALALLGVVTGAGTQPAAEIVAALEKTDKDSAELLKSQLVSLSEPGAARAAANDLLSKLKEFALERQIIEGKARMRALDPVKERAGYDELFKEISSLTLALDRARRGEVGSDEQEVWG